MIRTSLTVVPPRMTMHAAKAAVVAALALGAGQAVLFATFFAGRPFLADRPITGTSTSFDDTLPALLAAGLSVMMVALLGFGLAAALRSTTGALVTVYALVFAVPTLAPLLPPPWNQQAVALTPTNLPGQLAGTAPGPILPPPGALAAMTAYTAALPLAAAAVALQRRDA